MKTVENDSAALLKSIGLSETASILMLGGTLKI